MSDWFQPPPIKNPGSAPAINQFLGSIFSESPTANEDGTKIVVVDVNSSPKDPANQKIGHFRVPCIKTRLRAQPLIWKCFFIFMKIHFHNKILCTCWPHFESKGFWTVASGLLQKVQLAVPILQDGSPQKLKINQ